MPAPSLATFSAAERIGEEIAAISVRIDAARYRLLTLVREFDNEGGWFRQGARTMAHWLSWRLQIGLVAARQYVRVAQALPALPKIDQAFKECRVSYAQVRAMTRVATPENEQALLDLAEVCTAAQLERSCRKYRQLDERLAMEERGEHVLYLESLTGHYGQGSIEFEAPNDQVILVTRALDAMAEVLEKAERVRDPAKNSTETELTGPADRRAEGRDAIRRHRERSGQTRRAKALIALSEWVLRGELPRVARPNAEILVQVEAKVLQGEAPGEATLDNGRPLPVESARRLCCDGAIAPVLVQADGSVLDVGRRTRTIPPAMRRALRVRDDGCRFPGCGSRIYVEGHHIQHWAQGGATSLENLLELCTYHHTLVHEGGFRVEGTGKDARFHAPTGELIPRIPPRPTVSTADLDRWIGHDAIGAELMLRYPQWDGTKADYGAITELLLRYRKPALAA